MRKIWIMAILLAGLLLLIGCTNTAKDPLDTDTADAASAATDGQTENTNTEENTVNTEQETGAPTEVTVPAYDALMADLDTFPLTFTYGDKAYHGFAGFEKVQTETADIENGKETVTVFRTADINADFKLVTRVFPNENAYEYVVYIENNTTENTGVFSEVGFTMDFKGTAPRLSGLDGDGGVTWYTEYDKDLTKSRNKNLTIESTSGRPSHHVFPYFNLSFDESNGTFIALGWSGTWKASFRTAGETVTFKAGQREVNTYIAPGETLRTPLMAFVSYENKTRDEQTNVWRHYFINDVTPKRNGEPTPTMTGISTMSDGLTTDRVMMMLNLYKKNGVKMDMLWMDAGWYVGASGETVSWPNTGTQLVDTKRFPDSLSRIGTYCQNNEMQYLLWFEPEDIRLDKDTFLANNPDFKEEWLLDKTMVGTWLEGYLLNLGNAEARAWLTARVCKVMDDAGVTIYRQDFNSDPAGAWAANDSADRKGMTENQYVQGYLAYWDDLLARYPNLIIDSCASGGGRNDLETMKRSVPLHYSDRFDGGDDSNYDDKSRMTQSLFAWIPYFKNESYSVSVYKTRMNFAPCSLLKMPSVLSKDANWAGLRQAYDEYELIRGYFYADYYQLTAYSAEKDRWNGWEFYDPDTGKGYAQLSCNPDCTALSKTFTLKGLDESATYQVKDLDGYVNVTATGAQLMTEGIAITVPEASTCVIALIEKQ